MQLLKCNTVEFMFTLSFKTLNHNAGLVFKIIMELNDNSLLLIFF